MILFYTSNLNEVFFEQLRNLNKTWTIVPIIVIAPKIDFQEGEFIIKNGGLFYFEEGEINKQNLLKIFHAATNFKKLGKNLETAFGYTKEKESNLRTVLNNVEDAFILLDEEFHILDFNKPSLRFFEAMLGGFPQINLSFLDIATIPTEKAFWEKSLKNILLDNKRSIERTATNSITYKNYPQPC